MAYEPKLRLLQAARFTTRVVIAASGTPEARFQQRFKESRLPLSTVALDATAKRRSYTLADCYMLRLLEVMAGPGRLNVKPAIEALRDIAAHDLWGNTTQIQYDPFSIFNGLLSRPPETWDDAWRSRDLAAPYWVAAREYEFGWRSCTSRNLSEAMATLPRPVAIPPGGSFAVVLNLTQELARVDRVLGFALELNDTHPGVSDAE